ncbi:eukaryotic translation initiation factor 2D-like [Clytia hemisphaerica]|uniref:Ligatin n=1 Tax=Clytia hemisphaerica TaxID=252671 RepID=A0A7M5XES9_9CNID
MFKKPFKVKTNTAIRGSERRKIRETISKTFPEIPKETLTSLIPNKEEMSVMKILTYSERNVTCYCLKKNPIFFEVEGCILPTVYTLWQHPNLILSFRTFPNVLNNLQGGADLMFPGIIPPATGFGDFHKDQIAAVTLLGNGAAVAVGITTCSKRDIETGGPQGKKLTIYHCVKDHLWAAGDKSTIPIIEENSVQISSLTDQSDFATTLENLEDDNVEEKDEPNETEILSPETINEGDKTEAACEEEDEPRLSPQEEMDQLLNNCFCQAVINSKKAELPMLVTKFASQYLHPACPEGQRIDVKKSSYKKMSKFLSEMVSRGIIEMKEFQKGVESITKINQENETLREFKQSDFAKLAKEMKELHLQEKKDEETKNKQGVEIRELFSVSGKTIPFFKEIGISKGCVLASPDIRKLLMEYVKKKELIDPNNKKFVRLDPLLTDVLFKKGEHQEKLTWDKLMSHMVENMNPCCEIAIPGEKPIIRKGKMECIEVTTEKRMGNKKVTLVKNLDQYGIDLKDFAQELQQMAASSTALHEIPVGKNDRFAVQVQGVQTKHVKTLLDRRNIPKKYIKGLDNIDGKKKR